ncbi:MAG: radical SAM protein [Vicinamibacteria bacterium]
MSWTNWARSRYRQFRSGRAPFFVSVELVNLCNLHCAYCFRDEDMLYGKAMYLDPARLLGLAEGLPKDLHPATFSFTGGEPTLHPRFGDIVHGLAERGATYSFVSNGWHFDRVFDAVVSTRKALTSFCFSLDGANAAEHDAMRGSGSFDRLVSATTKAREARLPFQVNIILRKDTLSRMEAMAIVAARMGAKVVNFGTLLPTSTAAHEKWGLSWAQETLAREEAAVLCRALRPKVEVVAGLFDLAPGAHCRPLSGRGLNVDFRGRVTLCGNLSSFRGSSTAPGREIPENAATQTLGQAFDALLPIGQGSLAARDRELSLLEKGETINPLLGSPCLSCLNHFDKLSPGLVAMLQAGEGRRV